MRGKWIVDVKGRANSDSCEISVLREDNVHGIRSYGWFAPDEKRCVLNDGGHGQCPIDPFVFDRAVETAALYADRLNAMEAPTCSS